MVLADKDSGIVERLLTAGTSACIADFLSFPLDTAKVRLQVRLIIYHSLNHIVHFLNIVDVLPIILDIAYIIFKIYI